VKTAKEWMYDQTPEILGDAHLPIIMRSVTIPGIRDIQADALRWAAELCRDEAHKESNVMMSGAIRGMGVIISQQADAIERGGKESGE
jgi:hypothetical protein